MVWYMGVKYASKLIGVPARPPRSDQREANSANLPGDLAGNHDRDLRSDRSALRAPLAAKCCIAQIS
jgi:hypothetical protein